MSLCPMRNSISKKDCVGAECAWWFEGKDCLIAGCSVKRIAESLVPVIINAKGGEVK